MKSALIHIHIVEKAKSGILAVVLLLAVLSPVALAESATWSFDSATSSARLFQGSRANSDSVNTGVARVTGKVKLDTNDLVNSVVDLSIYPANENWGHALNPEGSLPAGYVADVTDHTLMTFKSERIVTTENGTLKVVGDLTLTRVERSVTADANEGYAGPVYGDPVIHTATREITFLLKNDGQDLSGSARVVHEDFPELLSAIQDTNWPIVIQDERCQMPSTVGEDYHGAACTGTVVAAARHDSCQIPASVGGEGYTGSVCTPPAGDQTTIVLDLKMVRTGSDGAVAMGQ